MNKVLLLDNYDSFTYNLYHLIGKNYKGDVVVKRDFEINNDDELKNYDAIIISPGPGRPSTTPYAMNLIEKFHDKKPILGICLGMQCINEFFGGNTVRAKRPVHGKKDILTHTGSSLLFKGVPGTIEIARYHSLMVELQSECIKSRAWTEDGAIMAIEHSSLPIYGLQFHPESFLCQYGDRIILNFLEETGLNG